MGVKYKKKSKNQIFFQYLRNKKKKKKKKRNERKKGAQKKRVGGVKIHPFTHFTFPGSAPEQALARLALQQRALQLANISTSTSSVLQEKQ